MKAPTANTAPPTAQLVHDIETVDQWSRGTERAARTAWLGRAIAWDLVGAVTMTTAASQVDADRVAAVLHTGLTELAAGPGDHIAQLVTQWNRALGTAGCHVAAATDDDVRWVRERLTMPVPAGADAEELRTLAAYAARAKDTRDFTRIECGGAAHLVVGVLGDRLVPILRV